jgi:hypothetical protein
MKNIKQEIEKLNNASKHKDAADLFCSTFGVEITATFLKNDFYFHGDKEKRDIYEVTIKRGNREFTFNFGQSIVNSGFYITMGRNKVNLPLEWLKLDRAKLFFNIRMKKPGFVINLDKIHFPKPPDNYDILATLIKYHPGTFEDFCSDFGYDTDSRNTEKTYNAVLKEYLNVATLFSEEEIEILSEIQ